MSIDLSGFLNNHHIRDASKPKHCISAIVLPRIPVKY